MDNEIVNFLEKAKEFELQLTNISTEISKISDKFKNIGEQVTKNSGKIGKLIGGFTSKDKKKAAKNSKNIKMGAEILGGAISIFGQNWASNKEEKLREKILRKKRKYAKEKIKFMESVIPKIQKSYERLALICEKDAQEIIPSSQISQIKFIETRRKGIISVFEAYTQYKCLIHKYRFFNTELKDWKYNEESKDIKYTSEKKILESSIKDLVNWSKIPSDKNKITENNITLGTLTLLSDENLYKRSYRESEVKSFVKNLATKYVLRDFLQKKNNIFIFLDNYLNKNDYFLLKKKATKTKYLVGVLILSLSIIIPYSFEQNIKDSFKTLSIDIQNSYLIYGIGISLGMLIILLVSQLVNLIYTAKVNKE